MTLLAIDWSAVSSIGGVLGVIGGLTIAGVAVYRARKERLLDRVSMQAEEAVQAMEELPFAILIVRSDQTIGYSNRQARLMTKYTKDELRGMKVQNLVPMRYRKAHADHMRGYDASPHTRPMGVTGVPLWMQDKFGEEIEVMIFLKPLEAIDNGPRKLLVIRSRAEELKLAQLAGSRDGSGATARPLP